MEKRHDGGYTICRSGSVAGKIGVGFVICEKYVINKKLSTN